jgi:hypothetical protein
LERTNFLGLGSAVTRHLGVLRYLAEHREKLQLKYPIYLIHSYRANADLQKGKTRPFLEKEFRDLESDALSGIFTYIPYITNPDIPAVLRVHKKPQFGSGYQEKSFLEESLDQFLSIVRTIDSDSDSHMKWNILIAGYADYDQKSPSEDELESAILALNHLSLHKIYRSRWTKLD